MVFIHVIDHIAELIALHIDRVWNKYCNAAFKKQVLPRFLKQHSSSHAPMQPQRSVALRNPPTLSQNFNEKH